MHHYRGRLQMELSRRDASVTDQCPQRPSASPPIPRWRVLLDELVEIGIRVPHPSGPDDAARERTLLRSLHEERGHDDALTALCLSGGGIRSATFSLGVLEGLAANGWLEKIHYLSTV